jgi:hypothetical protein
VQDGFALNGIVTGVIVIAILWFPLRSVRLAAAFAVNLAAASEKDHNKEKVMKVLMVITSHDQLGNTGRKTGFWLEELAAPYYVFKDAGVEITLASPKGGRPPLDPKSNEPASRTDLTPSVKPVTSLP